MYLKAKKYTSKYSDEKYKKINVKLWELFGLEQSDNLGSAEISFECGYWRKSNQIHNWFVQNVQDGEDNCEEHEVSRKQLIELKELCEKIVKILSEQKRVKTMVKSRFDEKEYEHELYTQTEEIEDLLPTKQGFFFGGYEYDEYYLDDMNNTIEIINKCLKDFDDDWDFSYRSSW